MSNENYISISIYEIIKEIQEHIFVIDFKYVYIQEDDEHFIYHSRPDLEYDDEFQNITVNLFKRHFYDKGIFNVCIAYGNIATKEKGNYNQISKIVNNFENINSNIDYNIDSFEQNDKADFNVNQKQYGLAA
jgi:hypothetical protein